VERRSSIHLATPNDMTNWEEQYLTKDTPWDKGGPSPALVDYLATLPVAGGAEATAAKWAPKLGRVLVPGCGMGYDVRALAAHAEEVVGLDIAPSGVAAARGFPQMGSERYEVGDLFALPEAYRAAFDFVWEHTCFCAIDRALRPAYVTAVARALRPGGTLMGVFYLDPGQALATEGPPFETTLHELDRLFSADFTLENEWAPARSYPGRERREWVRLWRRNG
jgi:SAM-dependent methyltransferase